MGQRLEIYTPEAHAQTFLDVAARYGIEARIIGRVEDAEHKELLIQKGGEMIRY